MIVSNLKIRTGCEGRRLHLTWTLPAGATHVRVYRRANDWNYYLDSPADLVYDGVAIDKFDDVPGQAWRELAGNTYYYYTVVVRSGTVPVFDVAPESRVFGLSIEELDGKDWIWEKVPKGVRQLDAKPKELGGGGGDMEKWVTVMGCLLNLERGRLRAIELHNDESKAPYPIAKEKNLHYGVEPDGETYDFTVVRKFNEKAAGIHKIKGTCPGLVEVVKVYGGWDAECVDLADTVQAPCTGPLLLRTYDGKSAYKVVTGQGSVAPAPVLGEQHAYHLRDRIEVRLRKRAGSYARRGRPTQHVHAHGVRCDGSCHADSRRHNPQLGQPLGRIQEDWSVLAGHRPHYPGDDDWRPGPGMGRHERSQSSRDLGGRRHPDPARWRWHHVHGGRKAQRARVY